MGLWEELRLGRAMRRRPSSWGFCPVYLLLSHLALWCLMRCTQTPQSAWRAPGKVPLFISTWNLQRFSELLLGKAFVGQLGAHTMATQQTSAGKGHVLSTKAPHLQAQPPGDRAWPGKPWADALATSLGRSPSPSQAQGRWWLPTAQRLSPNSSSAPAGGSACRGVSLLAGGTACAEACRCDLAWPTVLTERRWGASLPKSSGTSCISCPDHGTPGAPPALEERKCPLGGAGPF